MLVLGSELLRDMHTIGFNKQIDPTPIIINLSRYYDWVRNDFPTTPFFLNLARGYDRARFLARSFFYLRPRRQSSASMKYFRGAYASIVVQQRSLLSTFLVTRYPQVIHKSIHRQKPNSAPDPPWYYITFLSGVKIFLMPIWNKKYYA